MLDFVIFDSEEEVARQTRMYVSDTGHQDAPLHQKSVRCALSELYGHTWTVRLQSWSGIRGSSQSPLNMWSSCCWEAASSVLLFVLVSFLISGANAPRSCTADDGGDSPE